MTATNEEVPKGIWEECILLGPKKESKFLELGS